MKKILVLLFLLSVIGCESNSDDMKPTTLSNEYPGDISNVDKVELLDGSSGERRIVDNKTIVQEWLSQIKNIELIPDDNQEGRTGYIFSISLYEGDRNKLGFLTFAINDVYYETNEKFVESIRVFFEEQFGREF